MTYMRHCYVSADLYIDFGYCLVDSFCSFGLGRWTLLSRIQKVVVELISVQYGVHS